MSRREAPEQSVGPAQYNLFRTYPLALVALMWLSFKDTASPRVLPGGGCLSCSDLTPLEYS